MSGICGAITFTGPTPRNTLKAMASRAPWRGEPVTWSGNGALFCELGEPRRRGVEGSAVLVAADMRLDNTTELMELLAYDGSPVDGSPAELLVAAYRRWGRQFPKQLAGDYAIALWDAEDRTLLLARDPMAVRPLYYFVEAASVRFASEIQQLLADPEVPRRIFEPAVAAHLAGLAGPLDWTFYDRIQQVAPGTVAAVTSDGVETERFFVIKPASVSGASDEELTSEFRSVFERAVADRLNVPGTHGSFLSGGFDSGAAVATAGRLITGGHPAGRLLTYSFASEEFPDLDERHVSRHICEAYDLPNKPILLEDAFPLSDHPQAGPDADEPFIGHYQALYEATLRAATSQGVTQMWSANRGDQMTGGSIYGGLPLRGWLPEIRRQVAIGTRSPASIVLGRVLKPATYRLSPVPRRAAQWLRNRRAVAPSWINKDLAAMLDGPRVRSEADPGASMRDLGRQQRLETIFDRWQMRVATWTNRTQARFGMGWLDPWSDRRLVELVVAAEPRFVNSPSEYKRLTRRAMAGIMPEPARLGAVKPDMLPFYESAMAGAAAPVVSGLLRDSLTAQAGWVDGGALQRGSEHPLSAFGPEHLWQLLTLEMWLRRHW